MSQPVPVRLPVGSGIKINLFGFTIKSDRFIRLTMHVKIVSWIDKAGRLKT